MINGHPLLADGIAQSIDDLAKKAKLGGQLVRLQPTGFEQFAFWITALAPLLLLLELFAPISNLKFRARRCRASWREFVSSSFSSALPGGLAVGKQPYFCTRRYPRSHRSALLRPLHHHLWRCRRLPHSRLFVLGNGPIAIPISRSFPRPKCCSSRC